MLFGIYFGRPLQDYDVKPSNATFQSRRLTDDDKLLCYFS